MGYVSEFLLLNSFSATFLGFYHKVSGLVSQLGYFISNVMQMLMSGGIMPFRSGKKVLVQLSEILSLVFVSDAKFSSRFQIHCGNYYERYLRGCDVYFS